MSRLWARLSRLPLRVRLVAGFSAASLVVLIGAGVFVYWRVDYALDRGLDTELTQASQTLRPLVRSNGAVSSRTAADATGVAWQVLDADGTVLDHGGPAGATSLLSSRQLDRVTTTPRTFDVGDFLPVSSEPYRLQVVELSATPQRYLLVGVRRDHRDEALRELLVQLTVAGLGALLVTGLVGERLARAALRPVERYRRRAAAIAAGNTSLRLDVPPLREDEITRLGHTFNDMLTTLEGALDRERQFVTEASHELRTPITLLTSRIQLALRRPRSPADHERILTELKVDLDRLAALSEQLLQLGRVDGNHIAGRSDLVSVASRTVNQRRLADPRHAGNITVTLPERRVPVPMADFELERVVTNLLDNAVVHGAPPVEVSVDEPAPGWARLIVTDAGVGMPPGLLATATQRFARADDARPRPGSGLGLALVDALVTGASGELRLCHDGRHSIHGHPAPIACAHGPQMTVTVLLPTTPESDASAALPAA
ncbi:MULTISPECIES: ATP-binding protein [unclassified Nocardioides]|uniref:ATP-binding protein n=1 Tax=unclassified Nocardioides TaxID=2615069 RepID=UPI000056F608|nr:MULTISPECIES: ATP-binding protein [unclassified Nocardioides]ABL81074.1 ATP-binding region, ATPase domain protein [Nocardioides sp. JS614]